MQHFRSKVDFIPVVLLVIAVFLLDTAAMGISVPAMDTAIGLWPFALTLWVTFVPVLGLLAVLPVRYHLSARELVVRSGLLRWTIPVVDLHRACRQRSVRPAPALSVDRIRLDFQRGDRVRALFISPADPEQFLQALARRDKGLDFDDGDLVRRAGPILWFDNAVEQAG